jgi:hypothetical protein
MLNSKAVLPGCPPYPFPSKVPETVSCALRSLRSLREKIQVASRFIFWLIAIALQIAQNNWDGCRRPVLGGVLSLFLLLSSFLAVDASAHQWVHDDADHSEHHCLAGILAQQSVDSTPAAGLPLLSASAWSWRPSIEILFRFSGSEYRLLPGRAPPAAL